MNLPIWPASKKKLLAAAGFSLLLLSPLYLQCTLAFLFLLQKRFIWLRNGSVIFLGASLPLVFISLFVAEPFQPCAPPKGNIAKPADRVFGLIKPDSNITCISSSGHESNISIDSLGRRRNPPQLGEAKNFEKLVITAGCSFTFGLGVNDNETLAAQLEKNGGGKIRAVNVGVPGGGLQHVAAAYLAGKDLIPEIASTDKIILLYTMLPDHIHRLAHSGPWAFMGSGWEPVYDEQTLQVREDYARRIFPRFLRFKLGNKLFLKGIELYGRRFYAERFHGKLATAEEIQKFSGLVNILAKKFYADHPRGQFILNYWLVGAFFSSLSNADSVKENLFPFLDPRIKVVSYPNSFRLPKLGGPRSPDRHPNAESYRLMAKFILRAID